MKIVIIGATGTIGKAVVNELQSRHEIVQVGYQSGDETVDITNNQSIENLYQKIGEIDAVVMTTGNAHFGKLTEMTDKEFFVGINSKLMGQINVVLIGLKYLRDHGSFTLTSGVLSHDPILYGSAVSMVNSALDGFDAVPAAKAALAYSKSVEGLQTGQVYSVHY